MGLSWEVSGFAVWDLEFRLQGLDSGSLGVQTSGAVLVCLGSFPGGRWGGGGGGGSFKGVRRNASGFWRFRA